MADAFFLSEADRDALRRLLAEDRARRRTSTSRPDVPLELGTTPETYVALTPDSGIPPLEEGPDTGTALGAGDMPGSASCDIYQLIPTVGTIGTLKKTGISPQKVYNLSSSAIPRNTWILTTRDKFGRWYAITVTLATSTGEEPCTGCGGWIGLETVQCLKITVVAASGKCSCIPIPQGPFYLTNSGGWCWTADGNFKTCCADDTEENPAKPFKFCLGDHWVPTLIVSGTFKTCLGSTTTDPELALDCCTCNPTTAWFRGGHNIFCNGVAADDPCLNTFLIKVEVHCCPDPNWAGPGWYCVDIGFGCDEGADRACFYYGDAPCAGTSPLCSGPYDTFAECLASCAGTGTGTGTGSAEHGGSNTCAGFEIPNTLYISYLEGTTSMPGLAGLTVAIYYDASHPDGPDVCTWKGTPLHTPCGWLVPFYVFSEGSGLAAAGGIFYDTPGGSTIGGFEGNDLGTPFSSNSPFLRQIAGATGSSSLCPSSYGIDQIVSDTPP